MSDKNEKYRGFLFTEVIVALTILGILLIGLVVSLDAFRRFNHYQLVKQRCTSAAQAQLDSVTATGESIRDEDFKRLWPKLSVSFEKSAGTGQWEGMKLVKVAARGNSLDKEVKVKLSRYVLRER